MKTKTKNGALSRPILLSSLASLVLFMSGFSADAAPRPSIPNQQPTAQLLPDSVGQEEKTQLVKDNNESIEFPKFKNGDLNTFRAWIVKRLVIPEALYNKPIEGKVIAQFVLERDGKLSNIKIIKSPHPRLSKAVIRVLKASPKWTPGIRDGKPVRVAYTLPIEFQNPG